MSREELKLKLNNAEIEAFPFVGTPFDITVYVSDANDQVYQGKVEIPLSVSLCGDDNKVVEGAESIMSISPANICIGKNGVTTMKVTFKKLSMDVGNKKFKLLISASAVKDLYVKPVSSPVLTCVRHKICITEENKTQFVWMKDEGGREKCIELDVSLRDATGAVVRNRKVKLKMTLCYSSGVAVSKEAQKILTMPEGSVKTINEETGNTIIKYRINEVSKTHQSQAFCVLISPDISTSPVNADIAPCTSVAVEVRSKRNNSIKRARENPTCNLFDGVGSGSVSASSSALNLNAMGQLIPASLGGDRMSKKGKKGTAGGTVGDISSSSAFIMQLNNIVLWNNTVVEKLKEIRWKPIGQSESRPGVPSQPLYSIPNNIECIDHLLKTYDETVISSTKYLFSLSQVGEDSDPQSDYKQTATSSYSAPMSSISSYMGGDFTSSGADDFSDDLMSSGIARNNSLFVQGLGGDSGINRESTTGIMPLSTISTFSFLDSVNPAVAPPSTSAGAGAGRSNTSAINSSGNNPWLSSPQSQGLEDNIESIIPTPYRLVEDSDLLSSSKSSVNVNRLVSPEDCPGGGGRLLGCPSFNADNKLVGFICCEVTSDSFRRFFVAAHLIPDRSHGDDATNVLLHRAEFGFLEDELCELERKVSCDPNFLVDPSTPYDSLNHEKLYRTSSFANYKTMADAVVVFIQSKYDDGQ